MSGLILPPTPRASKSLLFANKQKDSLLINTKEPRIIFVGGSNLSFGLNSYEIKDSLNLNPVNTAIHASIGLKYMLENTLQYLKNGDIIILAPEYSHFFRSYEYTSDELLRITFDVNPEKRKFLSLKQEIDLLSNIPKFSITKYKPTEYWGFHESDVYSVNSFNKYGDADAHWNLKTRGYTPSSLKGQFNVNVFEKIKEFEESAEQKGAIVYVTFPSLDEVSFANSKENILQVENTLHKFNFNILGNARRYIMPKEMMFNSAYHLTKVGVDRRTKLFIEDFKQATKTRE